MLNTKLNKLLLVSCSLIAILLVSIFYSNLKLKQEITALKSSNKVIEENLKVLKRNHEILKDENLKLEKLNRQIIEESALKDEKVKSIEIEVDKTVDKLDNFRITVSDSIKWFKENNNVYAFDEYDKIKEEIANKCLIREDTCSINLKCIYEVNKKRFRYRHDEATTGKEDFLKDLNFIYDDYGGDCEDFSLLFRGEYNYLVDQCLMNYSRNKITSFTENTSLEGTYMHIICGAFNFGGHCLVAFTKDMINNSLDVYSTLKDSMMVEPQNGEYYGRIGEEDQIKIFPNGVPPTTLYFVSMVIAEDDLMIFDEYADEIEWTGYKDFLTKAQSLRESVKK